MPNLQATAITVARELGWPMETEGQDMLIALPTDWTDQILDLARRSGRLGLARMLPVYRAGLPRAILDESRGK